MDALLGVGSYLGDYIQENLDPKTTEYYDISNLDEAARESKKFKRVFVCCVPEIHKAIDKQYDDYVTGLLFEVLKRIECDKIILFSTIHVYNHRIIQDEDVKKVSEGYYGFNRFNLEQNLRFVFNDQLLIVRLPETFGIGLEDNNLLFDLMNKKKLNKININTKLSWYPMAWLFQDVSTALSYDLNAVNLFPEGIETSEIICEIFPSYKNEGYHGKRFVSKHVSKHENIYVYSSKSILSFMKSFVKMNTYIKKPNNMVVSNSAWDEDDDLHSIFLMKRYGISNVEILPTKYDIWKSNFENPRFHLKYRENGINVYSLNAILHGINADFVTDPNIISDHLTKVVDLCERVGGKVVVIGSPDKRKLKNTPVKIGENILSSVLDSAQSKNEIVKICLEPSSKDYGCEIGNTIESCSKMLNGKSFYMNFNTGNYIMEKDEPFYLKSNKVGHCNISSSFLRPIHHLGYERFKKKDINSCLSRIPRDTKISLEIKCSDVTNLGEQFRRFSTFMSECC